MGKRTKRISKSLPAPAPQPPETLRPRTWLVYLLLFFAIFTVYGQVAHFGYVNFDDPEYVSGNNHVRAGLTWAGAEWAFQSTAAANWFPLTWLSNMLVYQLFGPAAGWHHLANVLFHALASLLLFAAFHRMTGALWRSAAVAFLFALHPLHVESVAWIAERKDVLCGLFWFLTVWCYAHYVDRPSGWRYALVVLAFCGGLMSKSMIVTLPCVLLLLDIWPLRRPWRMALVREKLPLFALAAGVSLITYISQRHGNAVRSLSSLPVGERIGNAILTYLRYIVRTIWPSNLAVYYPYSHQWSLWELLSAGTILVGVTVLVVRLFGTRPYLAVGWFWYLGTLVPVIGLVQVGGQSSADRYTYLPTVGLTIMLSWGAADLVARYPSVRMPMIGAAVAACAACLVLTWIQIGYWANSGTLFQHAVQVTRNNYIAENNLADYYLTEKRNEDARAPVMEALRVNPYYPEAHINLATILRRTGQLEQSQTEYLNALGLQPENVDAHSGYGALLLQQNRFREALREFQKVVELRPDYAEGHYNLGRVLAAVGRGDQALAEFSVAVRLQPDLAEAHHSLGVALATQGRLNEALAEFAEESRLNPGDAGVHNYLGMLYASVGRLDEAIAQYTEALRLQPDFAAARQGLAAANAKRAQSPR